MGKRKTGRADFIDADWPAPANVFAGTTKRSGGISNATYAEFNLGAYVGDEPHAVGRNRCSLRQQLDLPSMPIWLKQVHGVQVATAPSDDEPEADACITNIAGSVCVVLTADCLPVLFASNDGQTVAAAHAGWRGLCAGVLEATLNAFDCPPNQIVAWLGPAISQTAFEVGEEVREQFIAHDPAASASFQANATGRWQADLYALARLRLKNSGVAAVYGGDRCTFTEKTEFFSYRRDGQCGRMASLIYRRT